MTTAFHFDPNSLNQTASGKWVKGTILPPSPIHPEDIVPASVLIQRSVPIAPGSPASYAPDSVSYKFDRAGVQGALPAGASVAVEVIGRFGDFSWFQGIDHVTVKRPGVKAQTASGGVQMPTQVQSTSVLPLLVSDPDGFEAGRFDLWYSAEGGETWTTVAENLSAGTYDWLVPPDLTSEGVLMLIAYDDEGVMGWNMTNVFEVMGATTATDDRPLPNRLSVRFAGRNPAPEARMELALPVRGRVAARVYDVRGALVGTLAEGELDAGYHPLRWDGRDSQGRTREPGVYFIRVVMGGQSSTLRFVRLD